MDMRQYFLTKAELSILLTRLPSGVGSNYMMISEKPVRAQQKSWRDCLITPERRG